MSSNVRIPAAKSEWDVVRMTGFSLGGLGPGGGSAEAECCRAHPANTLRRKGCARGTGEGSLQATGADRPTTSTRGVRIQPEAQARSGQTPSRVTPWGSAPPRHPRTPLLRSKGSAPEGEAQRGRQERGQRGPARGPGRGQGRGPPHYVLFLTSAVNEAKAPSRI